jgi:hypothetical protein
MNIQGTLATGTSGAAIIGSGVSGTFTMGVSGDLTGAGPLTFFGVSNSGPSAISWLKTTGGVAASYTGTVTNNIGTGQSAILTGDWSNAHYNIATFTSASVTAKFVIGYNFLKCKNFTITQDTTAWPVIVDNSILNVALTVSGNVDLQTGTGAYTTTWTKGTQAWTLNGTTGTNTLNFRANAIGPLVINASVGVIKQLSGTNANVTCDTLTLTSGTFDVSTLQCTSVGAATVATAGTFKIGNSGAGTGFVCAGFTMTGSGNLTGLTTSIITTSAEFVVPSTVTITTPHTLDVRFTGSGSFNFRYGVLNSNGFYKVNVASTTTLVISGGINSCLSSRNSVSSIINGILQTSASNGVMIGVGIASGSIFTLGASANITGAGTLYTNFDSVVLDANITWTPVTTHTGAVVQQLNSAGSNKILARDFSNSASVEINLGSTATATGIFKAGTLTCKSLAILSNFNFNVVINNAANATFVITTGNVDLNSGTGTYTVAWTAGASETWTFSGTTQSLDFNGQTIGALIISASGTKSIIGDFVTASLSGTAGTVQSNLAGTRRVITAASIGNCTGMTFKDISMGSVRKVNAKVSCVNLGNNLGIVFKDIAILEI